MNLVALEMLDHFGPDLDQLLSEGRQCPVFDLAGQCQRAQKIPMIVRQSKQLQADFIIPEIVAG